MPFEHPARGLFCNAGIAKKDCPHFVKHCFSGLISLYLQHYSNPETLSVMKRLLKLGLFVFVPIALCSCPYNKDDMPVYCKHLIQRYCAPKAIELVASGYPAAFCVRAKDLVGWSPCYSVDEQRYEYLSEKHGDSFNRTIRQGDVCWAKCLDLSADIVGLTLTSDASWDERHPAGSSLADVARVFFATLAPYIRSGYVLLREKGFGDTPIEVACDIIGNTGEYSHYIDKRISELGPDDMEVLVANHYGNFIVVYFDELPEADSRHNFHLSMRSDEGVVWQGSIGMDFDSVRTALAALESKRACNRAPQAGKKR